METQDTNQLPAGVAEFRQRYRSGRRGGQHLHLTLLGLEPVDTVRLLKQLQAGLKYRALEQFQINADLSTEQVADLVQIRPRTLSRRKEQGRLMPDESDRLVRASRVFGRALELFEGDAPSARRWLLSPQLALGGAAPLTIARTDAGAREVEDLVGRLEHGVFS